MNVGSGFIATTESVKPLGGLRGQRVGIVGAGIAGLTAALACATFGARVVVFERAAQIRELGAGIQITPNGARGLEALGLGPALEAMSLRAAAVVPRDGQSGRALARFDLSDQPEPGYRFFHRKDLIALLVEACRQQDVVLLPQTGVASLSTRGHLAMSNGQFDHVDHIIAADGIHSIARSVLNQGLVAQFSGQVAWRAVLQGAHPPEAQIWMGPKRHAVTYPLKGGLINLVAVQERKAWAPEGWTQDDSRDNLLSAFKGAAPELMALLQQVEQPKLWGLFHHAVAPHWTYGKLSMIGDAAHPTLPFLAQGANLAIEDAVTLALTLDRRASLVEWQDARSKRVSRTIAIANSNARNYHLSGPPKWGAHLGLQLLGKTAPKLFLQRLNWLYGFDPLAVN